MAPEEWGTGSVYRQLLQALESGRNRLAVATAGESKRTPLDKWNEYIRTERRILRCLRSLRLVTSVGAGTVQAWVQALESLRAPAAPGEGHVPSEAEKIARRLQQALEHLE